MNRNSPAAFPVLFPSTRQGARHVYGAWGLDGWEIAVKADGPSGLLMSDMVDLAIDGAIEIHRISHFFFGDLPVIKVTYTLNGN